MKKILTEWLPPEKVKLTNQVPVKGETAYTELNMEIQKSLQSLFLKSNQRKIEEIVKALNENDIKLAHRLAHTLKGNAGQLGKKHLQQAASDVELRLKDGKNLVTEEQLKTLEAELTMVLSELVALPEEPSPALVHGEDAEQCLDVKATQKLIEELRLLLEMGNPECRNLIPKLRLIPGTETIIQQMEDFDFGHAIITLAELKKILKII